MPDGPSERDVLAASLYLRISSRVVLSVLVRFGGEAGVAWPSVRTISAETGLSDRTVQRALRDLEAERLIALDGWVMTAGKRTNRWRITIPARVESRGDIPVTPDDGVTMMSPVGVTRLSPQKPISEPKTHRVTTVSPNAYAAALAAGGKTADRLVGLVDPVASPRPAEETAPAASDPPPELVAALVAEGFGRVAARALAAQFPERITQNLTLCHRRRSDGSQIKNWRGYIRDAIRHDWAREADAPPAGQPAYRQPLRLEYNAGCA